MAVPGVLVFASQLVVLAMESRRADVFVSIDTAGLQPDVPGGAATVTEVSLLRRSVGGEGWGVPVDDAGPCFGTWAWFRCVAAGF